MAPLPWRSTGGGSRVAGLGFGGERVIFCRFLEGISGGASSMILSMSTRRSASTAAGDTERARGSAGGVLGDRGRERGPGVVVHASHDGLPGPCEGGAFQLPNPGGRPRGLVSGGANRGSGGNWEIGPHGKRLPVGSPTSRCRASLQMTDPVPLRMTKAGMVVIPNRDMRSWPQGPMETSCATADQGIVAKYVKEASSDRHRETRITSNAFRAGPKWRPAQ